MKIFKSATIYHSTIQKDINMIAVKKLSQYSMKIQALLLHKIYSTASD